MDDVRKEIEEADADAQRQGQEEAGLLANITASWPSLPHDKLATILDRHASGETISDICRDLGISRNTVTAYMRRHVPREVYREVLEMSHDARLDEAEAGLRAAADPATVARARDIWKAVSWRASVECRDRWGQQPQTQVNVGGQGATVQLVTFSAQSESSPPNPSPNQ